MPPLDLAATALVIAIWGFNFVVGKWGLQELPPVLMMALRFALVAVLLLPRLRVLPGRMGRVVAIAFIVGVLHFTLMFGGLAGVDASHAAIAVQLFVPFSALLARLAFGEVLGRRQWAGMAVAFAGVWLLAGQPSTGSDPLHLAMVVGAALALAAGTVLVKRLGAVDVFTLNAWIAVIAAPTLLTLSFLIEDGQRAALAAAGLKGWGAVVFMAVGATLTAHGLWYTLIRRHPMTRMAAFTLLSPVLGVGFAVWLLDEGLTAATVAGGVLTVAGVAAIQFLAPRPQRGCTGSA